MDAIEKAYLKNKGRMPEIFTITGTIQPIENNWYNECKQKHIQDIKTNLSKYFNPDYRCNPCIIRSMSYVRAHNIVPVDFFGEQIRRWNI